MAPINTSNSLLLRPFTPPPRRTILVGDIHGCLDEFLELLELVEFKSDLGDVLIPVGDYVDRGPNSAGVVQALRLLTTTTHQAVRPIVGNHDERYPRYDHHMVARAKNPKYSIPMSLDTRKLGVYHTLSKRDLDFIQDLPEYLEFTAGCESWVAVHAGLEPSLPLHEQSSGFLTHVRYLDPVTKRPAKLDKDFNPPPSAVYWTELYDLDYHVVYGHMVHSLDKPRIEVVNGRKLIGLDTGCCFGGHLTGYIAETGEVIQVKAKRAYAPMANSHLY